MRLNQYNFTFKYRQGTQNQEADYLSRHPIEKHLTNARINQEEIVATHTIFTPYLPILPKEDLEQVARMANLEYRRHDHG